VDKMGNGGIIAGIFLLSLFFTSAFIGYFAYNLEGLNIENKIILPNSLASYSSGGYNDYSSCSFNITEYGFAGTWNTDPCNNIGLYLISPSIVRESHITIPYIVPNSDNSIINTYQITNTPLSDYGIILRFDGGNEADNNILYINNDGLHIPSTTWRLLDPSTWNNIFGGADKAFIPYANANQIKDNIITTTFNDKDNSVIINFNGNTYSLYNLNPDYHSSTGTYDIYAGDVTNSAGFTLKSFTTSNSISTTMFKPVVQDTLAQVSSLILAMLKVLTYSLPENIMPLWLQSLIIAPQEFMILLGVAMFIREG